MPRALSGDNPADVPVVAVKVRMTLKSSIDLTAVNFITRKRHRLTATASPRIEKRFRNWPSKDMERSSRDE
jgi:hypothetical protein